MLHIVDIAKVTGSVTQHNSELENIAGWKEGQILNKTGISKRYLSTISSEDLAFKALDSLNDRNNLSDVDLIISVTNTPQVYFPTIANFAHSRLGLKKTCKCIGINSGCTGFVEAYELVSLYFKNEIYSKALILTYDTYTHFLNDKDISTRALFSDGAAATLIEKNFDYHSIIESKVSSASDTYQSLIFERGTNEITMKGSEVFTFGLKYVKKDLKNMADKYPGSLVILHQAGKVMIEGLKKALGESFHIPCNYSEYGNLVSTSIPCLLSENLKSFNESKTVIMSGFGVGLSSHTLILNKD